MSPILFLTLLGAGPAHAILPEADLSPRELPVRHRLAHPGVQRRLAAAPAWRAFRAEAGPWTARFDEERRTLHVAGGRGVDLGVGAGASDEALAEGARSLLARHPDLLGVAGDHLRFAGAGRSASGLVALRFQQVVPGDARATGSLADLAPAGGIPVWGGRVAVAVRDGRAFQVIADTAPSAEAAFGDSPAGGPEPTLDRETAVATAIAGGPFPGAHHVLTGTSLVVLPGEDGVARLAWAVRTRTSPDAGDPPGDWLAMVDATTGALLGVDNLVRFLSGTVTGEHDTRTVDGDTSVSPLAHLHVVSDSDETWTDDDGAFELDGTGLALQSLTGLYVQVRNRSGSNAEVVWADGDLLLDAESADQAEIDSYVFLHQARDWGLQHAPDLSSYLGSRLVSNVNMRGTCNAYYDGNVNFYREGGGCNNTGRIADVEYHEWGHGLHAYLAGTWAVDGEVGEGTGDAVSTLLTDSPEIGPGFFTNGDAIREVDSDKVYPDDLTSDPHGSGLIFAGALWDLWDLLEQDLGDRDAAQSVVSDLLVDALRLNPALDETYDAVLAADDDDGDLSNGTPHQCAIVEAFGMHGLGPAAGGALARVDLDPVLDAPADADAYAVTGTVVDFAPGCLGGAWTSAALRWSADGGLTWNDEPLDISEEDGTFSAAIPGQSEGTVVWYAVELTGEDGTVVSAPAAGTAAPFGFVVGDLEPLFCTDFEDDDGGFTHEALAGEDEWLWGAPKGEGDDPDAAASGVLVWGTDLGSGSRDGDYANGSDTLLRSPAIDLAGNQRVVVTFHRWLAVQDGSRDAARLLANEAVAWSNADVDFDIADEQWAPTALALDVAGADTLELAWEIEADTSGTMGGWTVDDVCVYAAPLPAEDTGGGEAPKACGCSAAGGGFPAGLGWLGLLVGGLVARRRE